MGTKPPAANDTPKGRGAKPRKPDGRTPADDPRKDDPRARAALLAGSIRGVSLAAELATD